MPGIAGLDPRRERPLRWSTWPVCGGRGREPEKLEEGICIWVIIICEASWTAVVIKTNAKGIAGVFVAELEVQERDRVGVRNALIGASR